MSTDRLRTAPLNTEHLTFLGEEHPDPRPQSRATKELFEKGYPVELTARHVCVNDKPDDKSWSYYVDEIETTSVPLEDADYEQDKMRLFVCSCWDYVSRRAPFAKEHSEPTDATHCKHCKRVAQRQKQARADGQAALTETGQ